MRIQVAVEDRIARRVVAVARAAKLDAVAEGRARRYGLRVEVGRIRIARVQHPLVRVQVKDVGFLWPRVQVAKAHRVAQVAVVHVRGVVLVAGPHRLLAGVVPFQHQGWVAVGPRTQKELLRAALRAVLGHADLALQGRRHHGRAHAGGAVIDAHSILDVVQRVVRILQFGEGLLRMYLVVQDDGELPERLATAVAEDVLLLVLAGWCLRATVGALGQHDDGVEVAVHQAIAVAHVQDRARGAGADIAARLVVDVAIGVAPGRRGARGALQVVV